MTDAVPARYVVRTTAGDRGPFSAAQLAALVRDGKLPATAKVLDVARREPIAVADAIASVSAKPTAPEVEADRREPRATPAPTTARRRAEPAAAAPVAADRALGGDRAPREVAEPPHGAIARTRAWLDAHPLVKWGGAVAGLALAACLVGLLENGRAHDDTEGMRAMAHAHPAAVMPASKRIDDAYLHCLIDVLHERACAQAYHPRSGKAAAIDGRYDTDRYLPALAASIHEFLLHPDPHALNQYAWAIVARDDAPPELVRRARVAAEHAVEIDGGADHHTLDTLAWAAYRQGDATAAVATERRALAAAGDAAARAECEKALARFQAKR